MGNSAGFFVAAAVWTACGKVSLYSRFAQRSGYSFERKQRPHVEAFSMKIRLATVLLMLLVVQTAGAAKRDASNVITIVALGDRLTRRLSPKKCALLVTNSM
jgi:hypothetical protein